MNIHRKNGTLRAGSSQNNVWVAKKGTCIIDLVRKVVHNNKKMGVTELRKQLTLRALVPNNEKRQYAIWFALIWLWKVEHCITICCNDGRKTIKWKGKKLTN